jgi:arginyl-tRNA synthetase
MAADPLSDFDREIFEFLTAAGVPREMIALDVPAQREFGERSTNVAFRLAREWRRAPKQIAEEIVATFDPARYRFTAAVEPAGNGFINFRLNYSAFLPHALAAIGAAGEFGRRDDTAAEHVVVEHTSVNPNKEWHVGHVRNAVLGDVVARLLRQAGYEVEVQNYIDDTGVQAAQAVYGLTRFPEEPRPGEKYDHYVGRAYVKVNDELRAEPGLRAAVEAIEAGAEVYERDRVSATPRLRNIEGIKARVLEVMHALESGEYHGTTEAVLDGQLLTAYRLGIFYDLLNWESHLVQSRLFEQAMALLKRSSVVRVPQEGRYRGALVIETGPPPSGEDEPKSEVLIRSNGIPTYVGKDIAYHVWKFALIPDRLCYVTYTVQPTGRELRSTALEGEKRSVGPPDRVINIIAVDQTLPQEAVKEGLRAGGFPEAADRLFHLGYGLVNTVEGRQAGEKMSGRKGTAVAGDDVIDEAVRVALERVREKRSQNLTDEEMEAIAEAVGVGAVRYFMVQYNPLREIVFDVRDVVSYDGNTGLYIQYALVRMFAILRRARMEHGIPDDAIDDADATQLTHEQEKRLAFHLARYPDLIATASRRLAVNLVAEYAFDLATIFSQFYRDCRVLNAEPPLRTARLLLVRTVRDVLVNACSVLGVPVVERL